MALSTRLIRRRIKTVGNTKKITKAMELVAAAKMRRAVASMIAGRPYAQAALTVLRELAKVVEVAVHPLLRGNASGKTLVLLMTSDRGLCGGFNSKLFASMSAFMKGRDVSTVEFAVVGRKGQEYVKKRGWSLVAAWNAPKAHPTIGEVREIGDLVVRDFVRGVYKEVYVLSTDYRSALVQNAKQERLLPLSEGMIREMIEVDHEERVEQEVSDVFEPDPMTVLGAILPRLLEAQVYHAVLESLASEHSARMLAMRSATDNAGEMIESLTLIMNQARQAGITREIAEISAGAAAIH